MITSTVKHLRENQRQLDRDGCEVGISRQALDEVLDYIETTVIELAESAQVLADVAHRNTDDGDEWEAAISRARAAIAKATGN